MPSRRDLLTRSAAVAALLAAGVLPARAQSGWNKSAFETKSIDEALKALGLAKPCLLYTSDAADE